MKERSSDKIITLLNLNKFNLLRQGHSPNSTQELFQFSSKTELLKLVSQYSSCQNLSITKISENETMLYGWYKDDSSYEVGIIYGKKVERLRLPTFESYKDRVSKVVAESSDVFKTKDRRFSVEKDGQLWKIKDHETNKTVGRVLKFEDNQEIIFHYLTEEKKNR
jgi:hypothetical protein